MFIENKTKFITTAVEMPIEEDYWVKNDNVSEDVTRAWRQWLNAPRFRVYEEDPVYGELVVPLFVPVSKYGNGPSMERSTSPSPFHWFYLQGLVVRRDTGVLYKVLSHAGYDDESQIIACKARFIMILSGGDIYNKTDLIRNSCLEIAHSMNWLVNYNNRDNDDCLVNEFMHEANSIIDYAVGHDMLSHENAIAIRNAVIERENRLHASIYDVIYSSMDSDVLYLMMRYGLTESAVNYNWLVTSESVWRERRLAALLSQQFLIGYILRRGFEGSVHMSVLEVIDNGKDVIHTLTKHYAISEDSVARYGGVKYSWFYGLLKNDCIDSYFQELIGWLEFVDYEYWPRTQDEWMCCYIIIVGLEGHMAQYDYSHIIEYEINDNDQLMDLDISMNDLVSDSDAAIKYIQSVSEKGWLSSLCGLLRQDLNGISYKEFNLAERYICERLLAA